MDVPDRTARPVEDRDGAPAIPSDAACAPPEPFTIQTGFSRSTHDGFRALAHTQGHHCELRSRNGRTFKHWPQLCEELAHAVKAHNAILDGEIVCLDRRGRSNFKNLLFRRDWPYFYGFYLLAVDGDDLREWRRSNASAGCVGLFRQYWTTRLLHVDHVQARGRNFFGVACAHDLEGIVAKPANGRYHRDGTSTNWIKIKNPSVSPR
jgi:bifunctional non-homologous end joining protein LigD